MIVGIDEVGRGCLAGPLCMAAVVLEGDSIQGLTDSKKLTKKRREYLSREIKQKAKSIGIGWSSAREIDDKGISRCLELCAERAIKQITTPYSQIIIDGTVRFLKDERVVTIKQADLIIPSVSAASIIAKVARDAYMRSMADVFEGYGFADHVGYGTAAHLHSLANIDATPIHRHSFAPIADKSAREKRQVAISSGTRAEAIAADHLQSCGHRILERNWKTKLCEIDIVSTKAGCIYFTEVKYRRTNLQGAGMEYVTKAKLRQMQFAAEMWIHRYKPDKDVRLGAIEVSGQPMEVSAMVLELGFEND